MPVGVRVGQRREGPAGGERDLWFDVDVTLLSLAIGVLVSAAPDQLVGGKDFACWLKGGEVACFGTQSWREEQGLRPAELETAERVPGLSGVVALAAGERHVCALDGEARVFCWGHNTHFGGLGWAADGGANAWVSRRPVELPGFMGATRLFAGPTSTCARMGDGRLLCVGRAPKLPGPHCTGSLRAGTLQCPEKFAEDRYAPGPEEWPFLEPSDVLALGAYHACWRRPSGEVQCLGFFDVGKPAQPATSVRAARGSTALIAAGTRTCALFGSKRPPLCWHNPEAPGVGLEPFGPSEVLALEPSSLCTARGREVRCDGYLAREAGVPFPRLWVSPRAEPTFGLAAMGLGRLCALGPSGVSCLRVEPGPPRREPGWRQVEWPTGR